MIEAVRKGYYDALKSALSVSVYSRVPDEARPPFVVISAISAEESQTKGLFPVPVTVTILAVEAGRSPARADELTWDVVAALANATITLPSPYTSTPPRLVSAGTSERGEGDGKLWVGEVVLQQIVSE